MPIKCGKEPRCCLRTDARSGLTQVFPINWYINQQLGSGGAFSEAEQASFLNFQQVLFSKRNQNVPPQGQPFPRPKYIPKKQIKLFRKLFSMLQPSQVPRVPSGKAHDKHFVLSCVTSETGRVRPPALVGREHKFELNSLSCL